MMVNINQAMNLHNQGKLDEAQNLYMQILETEPENAYLLNLLGLLLTQKNDFKNAENYLLKACKLDPNENFLENLAVCYYLQEKYDLAMPYLEQALNKVPKDIDRIRDYAKLARDSKQYEYAIKFYSKSLELEKRDEIALNNIGLSLEALQRFDEAKNYYKNSLKVKQNYSAYHNLGVWYRRNREFDKSISFLKRALNIKPDNFETKTSLGMSYLSMKDFENGYKYYRYRMPHVRKNFINEWKNLEEHKDATLLIYSDGGRGDQLMFARYIPLIQPYFKKIIFLAFTGLKEYFSFNFPDIEVVDFDDKYNYQYSVNEMELHYHLGLDFDHIPFADGYLKADENKVKQYKEKYFNTDKLKIGLFWQGNLKVFPYRSMKLEQMAPLFENANCQFYSCQKGDGIEQLQNYSNIIDLGSTFENYADTAAALKNLDVLITIDTSIAHLAGALGVKTFLLLPYASEWRWFSETKKTDWYTSIELFKQETLFDWTLPINEVLSRLKQL